MTLPTIHIGQKPIYVKVAEDADFFDLFKKVDKRFDNCFIFESLGEEGKFARYSIMGFDPACVLSGRKNDLVVNGTAHPVEDPYLALRTIMPRRTLGREYAGGLVGYLGYEAMRYFEPSLRLKENKHFDRFMFGAYTDGLVLDKLTNELFYFYYDVDRSGVLEEIMRSAIPDESLHATFIGDTLTKQEHAEAVARVQEHIRAGNTFQCEVGFKSEYKIEGDALQIYERLRDVNPSPFMYYLKFASSARGGGGQSKKVIGASPELLFSLRGGEMTTRPLAGTTRRGKNEKEDTELVRALLNDEKERAEHNMLVDLHRNDIGRVAEFGSVRVKDLMSVKKFSHVQHISSEITGAIRRGEDMFSALAANFPAGTMTGAPKIESMKIIDENEPEGRGPSSGSLGHFGFNGDCTFAVTLRSIYISGTYGYAQTSGGIVYDSVPEKEYAEIQNKLAAMKRVLEQ